MACVKIVICRGDAMHLQCMRNSEMTCWQNKAFAKCQTWPKQFAERKACKMRVAQSHCLHDAKYSHTVSQGLGQNHQKQHGGMNSKALAAQNQ
jgi:hypothetical protein